MSKVRVFELAQELGIPAGELMTRLRKMGVAVKSHSSAVDRLVAVQLAGTSMRVHEVAKELGVTNKELTERLQAMGVEVKSHMSTVEPALIGRLAATAKTTTDAEPEAQLGPDTLIPPARTDPLPAPSPVEEKPAAAAPAAIAASPERRVSIGELADRAERLARLMPRVQEEAAPSEESLQSPKTVAGPPRTARGPRTLQERIEAAPGGRVALSIFAVAIVAAVLISNLPASYSGDLAKRRTGRALVNAQLYQGWNMFAPDPPTFNVRLVAVVRYTDGTRSTWSPPVYDRVSGGYRDFRWRRSDSISPQDSTFYNGLADWLARRQHAEDGRYAAEVIFYQATAPSPPPGSKQKAAWQLVKVLSVHPVLDT